MGCLSARPIKKIGLEIENNQFQASTSVNHTHKGSIGNLSTEEIREKLFIKFSIKLINKVLPDAEF